MPRVDLPRTGYVVKVYPRFSETFIVREILAHERAGAELEIFSLRPTTDARFHAELARVRAPVTHLPSAGLKAEELWQLIRARAADGMDVATLLDDPVPTTARDAHQAVTLAELVRAHGIGHLHAHFASAPATIARLAARLAGVSWSFTAHAKDIFHESVDRAALRRKLLDADAVVTVSEFNRRHLARLCPEAARRVVRVYNGLDLARFRFTAPGLPRIGPPLIAAVGRLVEKKGFADLVDACARLEARGVAFRCAIAGTGPLEGDLAARIDRAGLAGRIRLMGPATEEEVRRLLADATVLAAPCVIAADGNRDGLPTVLLEAMALGTPVVTTAVTGIPEVVHDGRTGILVPERDPIALAAGIDRVLFDPALAGRLAAAARALVERSFDADRNAAAVRDLFSSTSRPAPLRRRAFAAA